MTGELKSTDPFVIASLTVKSGEKKSEPMRKADLRDHILTALETVAAFGAAMTPQQAQSVNALAHALHWLED